MNLPGRIEAFAPRRGTRAGNTVAFVGIQRTFTPTRGTRAANPVAYAGILRTFTALRGTNAAHPTVFLGRLVAFGKAAFVGPFQPGPASASFFGKLPTISIVWPSSFTPLPARAIFAMIPPLFARAAGRAVAAVTRNAAVAAAVENDATASTTETLAGATATEQRARATVTRQ